MRKFDIVKWNVPVLLLSIFVSLACFASFFTKGFNFGVDFTGGVLVEIQTPQPANLEELRHTLKDIPGLKIQEYGSATEVMIRAEEKDKAGVPTLQKIKQLLGEKVTYRRVETIGPTVSQELKKNGLLALLFCLLGMLVYVWFRFEWEFGVGAVLAFVHDTIVLLGFYSAFQIEFSDKALIAILTTIGYSINDTVVVYDRLRENLRKYKKEKLGALINLSIHETFSRTLLTSATTLIATGALYLFGGEVIRSFSLPLFIGITVGTYSSIFIASFLLLYIYKRPQEQAAVIVAEQDA